MYFMNMFSKQRITETQEAQGEEAATYSVSLH